MAQYLSLEQLSWYAMQAGFSGDAIAKIVAIAWAESGGRIDAVGDSGNSVSLVQIYLPAHKDVDRQRALTDPLYAFQQAYKISGQGKNFNAWTTWSHATEAGQRANAQQYVKAAQEATQTIYNRGAAGGDMPNLTPSSRPAAGPSVSATAGNAGGGTAPAAAATAAPAAAPVDELPPDATPDQIIHYIQEHYPQAAPFLANPEIRDLLVRPDIDELDAIEVEALLRKTNYWQTHGPESRAFDALIGSDAQAASEAVGRAKIALGDSLSRIGLHPTDQQLGEAAKAAIRAGWVNLKGQVVDEDALNDFGTWAVGQLSPGKLPTGDLSATADELRSIAAQYFVPVSDADLNRWSLDIASGRATKDGFTSEMAGHSRTLFQNAPDVQKAIDAGRTPQQYFAPIKSIVAQTLELTDDQVDLMSPKYQALMQTYDPAIKGNRPMTLGEAANWARSLPEYSKTTAYRQQDAGLGLKLGAFFGQTA